MTTPPAYDAPDAAPAPEEQSEPQPVEFVPPPSFTAPDGTAPGDTFELVCTFEAKDGNPPKLCLTKLGKTAMPGYEDKRESPAKPSYDSMMPEGGAGGEPSPR